MSTLERMGKLEITSWGHASIGFERGGRRLLIDPGELSDPAALEVADAVLVTHEHSDHLSQQALITALSNKPSVEVWAPAPVVARLNEGGAALERVHEATEDAEFTAAGFSVLAIVTEHAVVHVDIPRIPNVAFVVEGVVLHPGDSFPTIPDGTSVETLFLPISAPWLKLAESVDYLRDVAPATVVPIHDAFLSTSGKAVADRLVNALVPDIEYRRLDGGESFTSTA
jgi:L-ascorbate metabolism protein UlaG (beta-lactamase superfamily)